MAEAQREVFAAGQLPPLLDLRPHVLGAPVEEASGREPVDGEVLPLDDLVDPRLEALLVRADVVVEPVHLQRVGRPDPLALGLAVADPRLSEDAYARRLAELLRVTAVGGGELRDRLHVALRVGEPQVGAPGRALEAGLRVGADPDLRARQRERTRRDVRLAREVLALVAVRLAREAQLEQVEHLLEHLDPLVARDAVGLEVGHLVGDPQPEHEPAARDPVEHDRVLGEPHRVVERRREHGGAEADPRRSLQQRGADEERRDERAAARLVELGQEDRVEAGLLGDGDLLAELLEVGVEARVLELDGQDHAEAHPSLLPRRLRREAERPRRPPRSSRAARRRRPGALRSSP